MPLDPDIALILEKLNAEPELEDQSIASRRRSAKEGWRDIMRIAQIDGVSALDSTIPGPEGQIPVRIYRRSDSLPGEPMPTIVYYHGGSWIIGDIETHDSATRQIARQVRAVVISVDYRLAPEHPFPAGLNDAKAALDWAIDNVDELGGLPSKVVISGDSAGGNFCAAISVMARDEGLPLAAQLSFYPSSDLSKRFPSMDEFGSGYLLETPPVDFADPEYLVDPELRFDVRVSPLLTESFVGVAPAVIYTAEFDPIKDHGTALAQGYERDGVRFILHEAPGMIHGFLQAGASPAALAEIDAACADLRELLDLPPL
ncbi:alpha/beta hydrolase [soil metagenome]